jgi:hypothetical protein
MDHGGWYDRKELAFKTLEGLQFAAAMGPPGGGRNAVTGRFLRHFSVIRWALCGRLSHTPITSKSSPALAAPCAIWVFFA